MPKHNVISSLLGKLTFHHRDRHHQPDQNHANSDFIARPNTHLTYRDRITTSFTMAKSKAKPGTCPVASDGIMTSENLPDPQQTMARRKLRSSTQSEVEQLAIVAMFPFLGFDHEHPVLGDPVPYLYAYGQSVLSARCKSCSGPLFGDQNRETQLDNFQALLAAIITGKETVSSVFRCTICQQRCCFACGSSSSTIPRSVSSSDGSGTLRDICCQQARLFGIFITLCAFDRLLLNAKVSNVHSKPNHIEGTVTGVQATSFTNGGVGYSYDNTLNFHKRRKRASSKAKPVDSIAKIASVMFRLLEPMLPRNTAQSSFDRHPPAIILPMLQRSGLIPRAVAYLIDDSLVDVSQSTGLYMAILSFLAALREHPLNQSIIFHARKLFDRQHQLINLSFQPCQSAETDESSFDQRSLYDLLGPHYRQAQTALAALHRCGGTENTDEEEEMKKLCEKTIAVYQSLQQVYPAASSPEPASSSTEEEPNAISAVDWHRENCLKDVPDEEFIRNYHFTKKASEMTGRPGKGRQKALVAEISNMRESLPTGIFVRYAETRPDMLKVLITGPAGTPYENGLFEFDFLCPLEYPRSPPKAHFKTTGGGNAHFNPNLYRDGKVCLSLLGTWEGEPWQSGTSTILQILVSIQAMIFCAEPWCNEPGRHDDAGSLFSFNYDKAIRNLTVQYSWLYWAKQSPKDLGIWADIVAYHYKNSGHEILATFDNWVLLNKAPFRRPLPKPKQQLSSKGSISQSFDPSNFGSWPSEGSLQKLYDAVSSQYNPSSGISGQSMHGTHPPSASFTAAETSIDESIKQNLTVTTQSSFDAAVSPWVPIKSEPESFSVEQDTKEHREVVEKSLAPDHAPTNGLVKMSPAGLDCKDPYLVHQFPLPPLPPQAEIPSFDANIHNTCSIDGYSPFHKFHQSALATSMPSLSFAQWIDGQTSGSSGQNTQNTVLSNGQSTSMLIDEKPTQLAHSPEVEHHLPGLDFIESQEHTSPFSSLVAIEHKNAGLSLPISADMQVATTDYLTGAENTQSVHTTPVQPGKGYVQQHLEPEISDETVTTKLEDMPEYPVALTNIGGGLNPLFGPLQAQDAKFDPHTTSTSVVTPSNPYTMFTSAMTPSKPSSGGPEVPASLATAKPFNGSFAAPHSVSNIVARQRPAAKELRDHKTELEAAIKKYLRDDCGVATVKERMKPTDEEDGEGKANKRPKWGNELKMV